MNWILPRGNKIHIKLGYTQYFSSMDPNRTFWGSTRKNICLLAHVGKVTIISTNFAYFLTKNTTGLFKKISFEESCSSEWQILTLTKKNSFHTIYHMVDHRRTDQRIMGSIPTPANKNFQSFDKCMSWKILWQKIDCTC